MSEKTTRLQTVDEKLLLLGLARVTDCIDDERDKPRALIVQRAGDSVRLVAMFTGDGEDAVARRAADA
jgi:hypothetical protein